MIVIIIPVKDHNRINSAMSLFIVHLQGLYSLVSKFHGHLWLMPLMISALIAEEKLKKRRINNNCYCIGHVFCCNHLLMKNNY